MHIRTRSSQKTSSAPVIWTVLFPRHSLSPLIRQPTHRSPPDPLHTLVVRQPLPVKHAHIHITKAAIHAVPSPSGIHSYRQDNRRRRRHAARSGYRLQDLAAAEDFLQSTAKHCKAVLTRSFTLPCPALPLPPGTGCASALSIELAVKAVRSCALQANQTRLEIPSSLCSRRVARTRITSALLRQ